ncbi:site-specific integrase [Aeromonas jandaei]|uniref:tyrosine-type recombinase/integrase n=2 Tax=Aeromonas jandaei TaxID=650 RepID=UPI002B056443|nr:site-specific integrase [Aeromonas jandaei]
MGIGDDITLIDLDVSLYPKLAINVDMLTGVITPTLKDSNNLVASSRKIKLILGSDRCILYPHSLYLHRLVSKRGLKNTDTHAKALLLFARWLNVTGRSYRDIKVEPRDGVAWQFGDWLIEHDLRSINDETGEVYNPSGLSINTAKSYMYVVIDFYKWLNREGILVWSESIKPFNFHTILLSDYNAQNENHMLSHIMKRRAIVVTTTDRMMEFPKIQSMASWQKLKPLTNQDQSILKKYINLNDDKSLMILLAWTGGLRINEIATLSEISIYSPVGEFIKLTLDPSDGVMTKGGKKRTTIIPSEVMQALYEYKLSSERLKKIKNNACKHRRLFVTRDGKPYDVNTIETTWSKIRNKINDDLLAQLSANKMTHLSKKPLWFYRFHDLRSTFATEWLRYQQQTRNAPYDFYFNELKDLMGHELNTDTQKYIDFTNNFDIFSEAASRRNAEALKVLKGL